MAVDAQRPDGRRGTRDAWPAGSSPSTTSGSGSSTSPPPASSSCSAGILALLIRSQLATADNDLLTGDSYNEVVTIHGTAMVFLVVVPILAGLANFLVPLDDRRRGHGVPAAERALLLALPVRRRDPDALVLRSGWRGADGLDRVPTAVAPVTRQRAGPVDPLAPHPHRSPRSSARSTSSSRSTTCGRAG